jgi:hypothetical protein
MPYIIPQDWDGTWACFQIQWPDSPYWRAIMRGMLSDMARGRLWDETTGQVRNAQAIGVQIRERNLNLPECEGDNRANDYMRGFLDGYAAGEIDNMPVGMIIDLKCVDGALWMRRYPCCEWEIVPGCQGILPPETPGDLGEGETEPNEDGWYLSNYHAALTIVSTASSGWTETCRVHTPEHDVFGVVFVINRVVGTPDLKQMNNNSECGFAYPSLWNDTSGSLVTDYYISMDATLAAALEPTATLANGGVVNWPTDPYSAGRFAAGQQFVEGWSQGYNTAGQSTIGGFQYVHNINSPSHQ